VNLTKSSIKPKTLLRLLSLRKVKDVSQNISFYIYANENFLSSLTKFFLFFDQHIKSSIRVKIFQV